MCNALQFKSKFSFKPCLTYQMCVVWCHSVISISLGPQGLESARLPCPWGFSRQKSWTGFPCPPPGYLPNPGMEPRSPAMQEDSLLSEPPEKPLTYYQISRHNCQLSTNKNVCLQLFHDFPKI